MSSNWEVRFSNSRQLPYFYNGASGVSVWERPEEISEEQVASLPGAQLLNATNGGNSGGEAGGQVRASHLLVKHKGSRRPSSWKEVSAADKANGLSTKECLLTARPRQSNITRTPEEAEAILRDHAAALGPKPTPEQFASLAKVHSCVPLLSPHLHPH